MQPHVIGYVSTQGFGTDATFLDSKVTGAALERMRSAPWLQAGGDMVGRSGLKSTEAFLSSCFSCTKNCLEKHLNALRNFPPMQEMATPAKVQTMGCSSFRPSRLESGWRNT
jgi:hypothetical protein